MPRYTITVMDLDNPRAGATLNIWARDDTHAQQLTAEAVPEIVTAWQGRFKDPHYTLHDNTYPRKRRSILASGPVKGM